MTRILIGQSISVANVCMVWKIEKQNLFACYEQIIHEIDSSGDYDIRVEQAEFSEISVTASGEAGATVSIVSYCHGSKVMNQSSLKILKMCKIHAILSL